LYNIHPDLWNSLPPDTRHIIIAARQQIASNQGGGGGGGRAQKNA
jgi:hypothetical protein